MGRYAAVALMLLVAPCPALGQVEARAVLSGTAFVGDTTLSDGTVVLHHLSDDGQGELDSVRVGSSGAFSFELPTVPDPARSDIFFASLRHDGVLYFGPAITLAVQLDSVYEIHAYDTLLAAPEGAEVAMQSRSVFFEPDRAGWRVTDLFQLRNDRERTVVARPGGRSWSYPLPDGARDVSVGEGEMSPDAASFDDGRIVVRAALPPGERLFVVRYALESRYVDLPTPGRTELMDVLVREPAPALTVEGFELTDRIELEPGSTYRRYTRADFAEPFVRVVADEVSGPPPVRWIAVLLGLVLTVSGLMAIRAGGKRTVPATAAPDRRALLEEVALLDAAFEAKASPTEADRRAYDRHRSRLLDRLRASA